MALVKSLGKKPSGEGCAGHRDEACGFTTRNRGMLSYSYEIPYN
jgi:hypothetical protein